MAAKYWPNDRERWRERTKNNGISVKSTENIYQTSSYLINSFPFFVTVYFTCWKRGFFLLITIQENNHNARIICPTFASLKPFVVKQPFVVKIQSSLKEAVKFWSIVITLSSAQFSTDVRCILYPFYIDMKQKPSVGFKRNSNKKINFHDQVIFKLK